MTRLVVGLILCLCWVRVGEAQSWLKYLDERKQAAVQQFLLLENPDAIPENEKLFVQVGPNGGLLVEGESVTKPELSSLVLDFIENPDEQQDLPSTPARATVVLDWKLRDAALVGELISDLIIAYVLLRDQEAVRRYGKHLIELTPNQRAAVEEKYPYRIVPYPVVYEPEVSASATGVAVEDLAWEDVPPRNRMRISVEAGGQIRFQGKEAELKDLQPALMKGITNPEGNEDLPESPANAYVFVSTSPDTPYKRYIEVVDTVWATYKSLWNEKAEDLYERTFDDLEEDEKNRVKSLIPAQVSIGTE